MMEDQYKTRLNLYQDDVYHPKNRFRRGQCTYHVLDEIDLDEVNDENIHPYNVKIYLYDEKRKENEGHFQNHPNRLEKDYHSIKLDIEEDNFHYEYYKDHVLISHDPHKMDGGCQNNILLEDMYWKDVGLFLDANFLDLDDKNFYCHFGRDNIDQETNYIFQKHHHSEIED